MFPGEVRRRASHDDHAERQELPPSALKNARSLGTVVKGGERPPLPRPYQQRRARPATISYDAVVE